MKKQNNILTLIVVFLLIFLIQSCSKSSNKNISIIPVYNDSIKGQAFIGENRSSVEYSPKGNFIQVIKPDSGIWTNLIIEKSNKQIKSKQFFPDEDIYISNIYDSLSFGEYNLKFVSDFKDTITEKLNFEQNIQLKFPSKLKEFYKVKEVKHFKIDELTTKDTLQIVYESFGCFGGSEQLIEFMQNENNEITFRKKISGLRYEDEPEDEWIYSKKNDVREKLMNFVSNVKTLDNNDPNFCSSKIQYILRIKGNNTIYLIKDKSCKFGDELSELIRTR